MSNFYFFFFFQAEDGIRDSSVTGVQTCALPIFASAQPDLLAVETIPDLEEAEVLVPLLDEIGLPAWLSYSCAGSLTRAGQPLADAFAVVAPSRTVVATGVNCCAPDDVLPALEV